jgi:hypothetical protein
VREWNNLSMAGNPLRRHKQPSWLLPKIGSKSLTFLKNSLGENDYSGADAI